MATMNFSIALFSLGVGLVFLDVIMRGLFTKGWKWRDLGCSLLISTLIIAGSYCLSQTTSYTCFNGHCGYPEEDAALMEKINNYKAPD